MTYVKIQTKNSFIELNETVDFDFVELPYGAIGYRNNGSSESPEENLNKYWNFVDAVLINNHLSIDEYITLLTIIDNNVVYGFYN